MIRGAVVAGALLWAAAAQAGESVRVEDGASQFALELPAALAEAAPGAGAAPPGVLVARVGDGLRLTVSRIEHANRDAWRGRDRFFSQVERGVADASPGYRLLHSRRQRLGRVPALDLRFRRDGADGPERVAMRFLFFRRYSVVLTVVAGKRHTRAADAIVRSFRPYFAPAPP